ncbi:SH3 domain-containing protein [bacterium]|nr:SH3 domain-containing protein [bacterium]
MKTFVKTPVVCALLVAFQIHTAISQETKKEIKYEDAPKVVLNATAEMQTPEFWISRLKGNPDAVLLSPAHIDALNKETAIIREKVAKLNDINGKPVSIDRIIKYNDTTGAQFKIEDPLSLVSFPGDSLRARLRTNRTFFDSRTYYDDRRMTFDNDKKNQLYDMTDAGSIPDVIKPRYGIITVHATVRVLPTDEVAYGKPDEWYIKGLQAASADVAMPVAILHESKNKDWYFVRSETAFGWVRAVNIALGSPEVIRKYIDAKDFIVALTYTVPVYSNKNFSSFITDLYMGSRFKLVEKTDKGYHVLVPFRKPDGSLETVDGWVKPDAKVSVGYQPFTQRNVINTLFSLLYRPYAWNDGRNEWNCCGYIRVVLRTFGIFTGSWPAFELHWNDHVTTFPSDTPRETKYQYLEKCDPGVTLVGSDGHILMYLGKVNDKHYVIHMGGYDYTTDDGTVMMYRRVNVNDTELKGGYNIDDWTKISPLYP